MQETGTMSIFAQLNPYIVLGLIVFGLIGSLVTIMWLDLCPFCDKS